MNLATVWMIAFACMLPVQSDRERWNELYIEHVTSFLWRPGVDVTRIEGTNPMNAKLDVGSILEWEKFKALTTEAQEESSKLHQQFRKDIADASTKQEKEKVARAYIANSRERGKAYFQATEELLDPQERNRVFLAGYNGGMLMMLDPWLHDFINVDEEKRAEIDQVFQSQQTETFARLAGDLEAINPSDQKKRSVEEFTYATNKAAEYLRVLNRDQQLKLLNLVLPGSIITSRESLERVMTRMVTKTGLPEELHEAIAPAIKEFAEALKEK